MTPGKSKNGKTPSSVNDLIPIIKAKKNGINANNNNKIKNDQNYEYEPDQEEILDSLLPKNITTQIFKGLLENAASEQGARMSAMDNATRNAGDLIEKLTINYNRSRQAVITKELIEIISGAETL